MGQDEFTFLLHHPAKRWKTFPPKGQITTQRCQMSGMMKESKAPHQWSRRTGNSEQNFKSLNVNYQGAILYTQVFMSIEYSKGWRQSM